MSDNQDAVPAAPPDLIVLAVPPIRPRPDTPDSSTSSSEPFEANEGESPTATTEVQVPRNLADNVISAFENVFHSSQPFAQQYPRPQPLAPSPAALPIPVNPASFLNLDDPPSPIASLPTTSIPLSTATSAPPQPTHLPPTFPAPPPPTTTPISLPSWTPTSPHEFDHLLPHLPSVSHKPSTAIPHPAHLQPLDPAFPPYPQDNPPLTDPSLEPSRPLSPGLGESHRGLSPWHTRTPSHESLLPTCQALSAIAPPPARLHWADDPLPEPPRTWDHTESPAAVTGWGERPLHLPGSMHAPQDMPPPLRGGGAQQQYALERSRLLQQLRAPLAVQDALRSSGSLAAAAAMRSGATIAAAAAAAGLATKKRPPFAQLQPSALDRIPELAVSGGLSLSSSLSHRPSHLLSSSSLTHPSFPEDNPYTFEPTFSMGRPPTPQRPFRRSPTPYHTSRSSLPSSGSHYSYEPPPHPHLRPAPSQPNTHLHPTRYPHRSLSQALVPQPPTHTPPGMTYLVERTPPVIHAASPKVARSNTGTRIRVNMIAPPLLVPKADPLLRRPPAVLTYPLSSSFHLSDPSPTSAPMRHADPTPNPFIPAARQHAPPLNPPWPSPRSEDPSSDPLARSLSGSTSGALPRMPQDVSIVPWQELGPGTRANIQSVMRASAMQPVSGPMLTAAASGGMSLLSGGDSAAAAAAAAASNSLGTETSGGLSLLSGSMGPRQLSPSGSLLSGGPGLPPGTGGGLLPGASGQLSGTMSTLRSMIGQPGGGGRAGLLGSAGRRGGLASPSESPQMAGGLQAAAGVGGPRQWRGQEAAAALEIQMLAHQRQQQQQQEQLRGELLAASMQALAGEAYERRLGAGGGPGMEGAGQLLGRRGPVAEGLESLGSEARSVAEVIEQLRKAAGQTGDVEMDAGGGPEGGLGGDLSWRRPVKDES